MISEFYQYPNKCVIVSIPKLQITLDYLQNYLPTYRLLNLTKGVQLSPSLAPKLTSFSNARLLSSCLHRNSTVVSFE